MTDRFAAECKAAGMKISTSKSETMVLNQKKVPSSGRGGDPAPNGGVQVLWGLGQE